MSETLELTKTLIARPSVTPDDAGCQEVLIARLESLGFRVERLRFGEVDNIWLRRGDAAPVFAFAGHTDVVPTGPCDAWQSDPFGPEIREGLLYGRGACDMKGAVAAMVVALERFCQARPGHTGELGLLLTSDEEGVAIDGIRRVAAILAERGTAPDHCLVGEPSSREVLGDSVRIGRRGSNAVTLTVPGVQGHTAFPETIDNPVHRLAPFLAELVARRWDEGVDDEHGRFPPSHCQVSNLQAGVGAMNVTPPEARVTISFRNNTRWPAQALRAEFEGLLAAHGITRYELEWQVSGEPFLSRPGPLRAAVVAALRDDHGITPDLNTGGGTSDGRFIAPLGTEVVELGLLNASIHKVDENAPVADLDALAAVYAGILERLHPG